MRSCKRILAPFVGVLVGLCPRGAVAEPDKPKEERADDYLEHAILVGVGGAVELELADRSLHPGTNLMVEWDAIENWLELEVSASVLTADRGVAVPIDVIIKKPFRVTRTFEIMIGVGPEVVQVTGIKNGTYVGGQAALDLMFWPYRRFGLWVEPTYDLVFYAGISHGIGCTGGLMVGW